MNGYTWILNVISGFQYSCLKSHSRHDAVHSCLVRGVIDCAALWDKMNWCLVWKVTKSPPMGDITRSGTYFLEKCSFNGDIIFVNYWKNLKLGKNKLKLDFELLPKNIFSMRQYPPRNWPMKSTPIRRKMKCNCTQFRHAIKHIACQWNTCHRDDIVKWHTNYTYIYINFHMHFCKTVILGICFRKFITKNAAFVV